MRYRYSRLKSNEEKKNIRSAAVYIVLTIAVIVALLTFGIPAMGRVAGFFHDLRTSGEPVDISDTTPPAPPIIDTLPEVTKSTEIEITGRTEAGATVKLHVNDDDQEVLANSEGAFSYKWQ